MNVDQITEPTTPPRVTGSTAIRTVSLATRTYQFFRYNMKITVGLFLVLVVVAFGYIGPIFVDLERAEVGMFLPPGQPPSAENWLGTDAQGRDMLAWLIDATPDSLRVGVMAGALGVFIGASVGFIGGYYGGWIDTVLRTITDISLAVPGLLVLIVLASMVDVLTLEQMAIVIAAFAWMGAARVIRAQVLSLRERQYVEIAKMSGEKGFYIVFFELMPNLMPFLLAAFVGSLIGAILAAVGLEFLGLGATHISTLGNILYWQNFYNAVIRGMWWWWGSPIVIFIFLFAGLFIASIGLDEWANPRLKERA
jgi:peptide/nickel transport system permease protein